jgi:hypothetical protein
MTPIKVKIQPDVFNSIYLPYLEEIPSNVPEDAP